MTPGEVLDAQADLDMRLHDDPEFGMMMDSFGNLEFSRAAGHNSENTTPFSKMLMNNLRVAHTYRVTHDMSMVVEHAASQLDDLDKFDRSLAPTGAGFVALDRPLPLVDQRGRTMLVHYILWGPASAHIGGPASEPTPCTLFSMFNDQWRKPDQVSQEMEADYARLFEQNGSTPEEAAEKAVVARGQYAKTMGRWAAVGSMPVFNDQRLGPRVVQPSEDQAAKILADGDTPAEGTNATRYLHALWLLMGQTMARVEEEHVERPARRRWEKRTKKTPKVSVIRLRREAGASRERGESDIEWAHRWVVKGHWRRQVCGPHHILAQETSPGVYHARIWINPYVKGPEDAPIVQTPKVYSLER